MEESRTPLADRNAAKGAGRALPVPSVNYHLWKHCNMRCGHCFATFKDVEGCLSESESLELVGRLARAGLEKINFAGGEPMLCQYLDDLVRRAKRLGMTTSVVTNGSLITQEWASHMKSYLDWVAMSIDSAVPGTHLASGRATAGGPISGGRYRELARLVREHMRLKINTVVTAFNWQEDMTGFVIGMAPERWKIMQALYVAGQNGRDFGRYAVSDAQFASYVSRCMRATRRGIRVIPESNDTMRGSYLMVSPGGRFFDSVSGRHLYSDPILDVGVERALEQVSVDPGLFRARGGLYDW